MKKVLKKQTIYSYALICYTKWTKTNMNKEKIDRNSWRQLQEVPGGEWSGKETFSGRLFGRGCLGLTGQLLLLLDRRIVLLLHVVVHVIQLVGHLVDGVLVLEDQGRIVAGPASQQIEAHWQANVFQLFFDLKCANGVGISCELGLCKIVNLLDIS